MKKIKNLVIPGLDSLKDELLEIACKQMGLKPEVVRNILKDHDPFVQFKDQVTELIVNQYDDYLIGWRERFNHIQEQIISIHPEFFRTYFMFIHGCHNVFDNLQKELEGKNAALPEVMILSLYGNLCKLADDIGNALSVGSTRTALTLWRSFYEYAVCGIFLMKEDQIELYQRFADFGHRDIQKKKDSIEKHHTALKFPRLPEPETEKVNQRTADLKNKYGEKFFADYGWATGYVDERPSFWAIEKKAGMEKYRPFYIWASGAAHPNFQDMTPMDEGRVDTGRIIRPATRKENFFDPAQLTLAIFCVMNDYVLYRYSVDDQYLINKLIFEKTFEKLKNTFN